MTPFVTCPRCKAQTAANLPTCQQCGSLLAGSTNVNQTTAFIGGQPLPPNPNQTTAFMGGQQIPPSPNINQTTAFMGGQQLPPAASYASPGSVPVSVPHRQSGFRPIFLVVLVGLLLASGAFLLLRPKPDTNSASKVEQSEFSPKKSNHGIIDTSKQYDDASPQFYVKNPAKLVVTWVKTNNRVTAGFVENVGSVPFYGDFRSTKDKGNAIRAYPSELNSVTLNSCRWEPDNSPEYANNPKNVLVDTGDPRVNNEDGAQRVEIKPGEALEITIIANETLLVFQEAENHRLKPINFQFRSQPDYSPASIPGGNP